MVVPKVNILGVNISVVNPQGVVGVVEELVAKNKQIQIVTPNPEHIIQAQSDREFMQVLNHADLAVADGIGVVWAARLKGEREIKRVTGVDLMQQLLVLADNHGWNIGLVGGSSEVRTKLTKQIGAVDCGGHNRISDLTGESEDNTVCTKIKSARVDLIFVAYGAPYQEKWIADNLRLMPKVKIAIGVGGAFDFMVGRVKRAPMWVQNLGFEWLYRLIHEPWRWRRQLRLIEFVMRVIFKQYF